MKHQEKQKIMAEFRKNGSTNEEALAKLNAMIKEKVGSIKILTSNKTMDEETKVEGETPVETPVTPEVAPEETVAE